MPDPNDGVVDMPIETDGQKEGEAQMPEGDAVALVDVPDDVFGIIEKEDMEVHGHLMAETSANIQHVHNVARNVAVKQYHQVDPIEAAAAEVILRIKPLTK